MTDTFDFFIALDGHGLYWCEGLGLVARLRLTPDDDHPRHAIKFFEGSAGVHATQINKQGTIGFLGNLSQTLLFFDPRTLEETKRFSTLRFAAPDTFYSS